MAADPLASVFLELDRARKIVKGSANRQVRSREDRDILSATAFAWFQSHRKQVQSAAEPTLLEQVDFPYKTILDATARNATKSTYLDAISAAKTALVALRGQLVVATQAPPLETPPDFSPLVGDAIMRGILIRRWDECQKCLSVTADLAAIVMMGGLLEALFVARANKMTIKSPLFKAKATPLDKNQKPIDLRDWTLGPYIDVGHELKWITKSGKDVAAVLRDYRNYVHPEKERSHGIVLNPHDSAMLWDVTKNLARQLLASTQQP